MQTARTYRTNRDLFANYYLDEHLPETEEWDEVGEDDLREAYDDILGLWNAVKDDVRSFETNESRLEDEFIRPMFRTLGIPYVAEERPHNPQRRPDYGFFETDDAKSKALRRRDEGGNFYENAVAVADAKRWGRPLDTRGSGEHQRDFENPSYQIHRYLRETSTRWAVLTNGQQWRLYYGPTSHRLDSYYEVDLPTVLEDGDRGDFKYFYLLFRHQAFLEDAGGECFLDSVYAESNVFAREVGEDLQDNVYEAITVLSEGFLQSPENDLDEESLDLVYDSALVYLYRLMFVLYAEAEGRELLDTSNETYEQSYSLNALTQDVAEEMDSTNPTYRDWQDTLQSRLDELFMLIDQGSESRGIPEEDLYVPAYNGGLFRTDPDADDSKEARFLAEFDVGDAYVARVIELLTRRKNGDGGEKTFVDYSSLDVRHLGSIYEELLEHELNVADEPLVLDDGEYVSADEGGDVVVEEGKVYLTTDSGERRSTGSYYTPEYVVEYIVENTLEPLVRDIREDLVGQTTYSKSDQEVGTFADQFAERVFDLKLLDPAMGSGHFLTGAIDYLAREIVDVQEKQATQQGIDTVDKEHDINWARRQVAQHCLYGVDLNPLAVELAKVSLWLRTSAAEEPLAFLDHHLKTGNSLIGSSVEDVLANGESATEDGPRTLQQSFARTRRQALEHVMDCFRELLSVDNESVADVEEMDAAFEDVRSDPLYQHLLAMANVHAAEDFGLNVPGNGYERMAQALRNESWDEIEGLDWFADAQLIADDEGFVHWELEFPVAFYDADGTRKADAGFDAVLGNPPYISAWNRDLGQDEFFRANYNSASGHYDIYGLFIENGADLLRRGGRMSMIIPDTFCGQAYAENCRKLFTTDLSLETVLDLRDRAVFEDAQVDTIVFVAEGYPGAVETVTVQEEVDGAFRSTHTFPYQILSEEYEYRVPLSKEGLNVSLRNKIASGVQVQEAFYVSKGMEPHTADGGSKYEFISKDDPTEGMDAYIEGKHIGRWRIHATWYIDYSPHQHKAPAFRELFESKKIVGTRTIGEGRPMFAIDEYGYYNNEKTLNAVPYEALQDAEVSQVEVTEQKLEYCELFSLYAVVSVLNSKLTAFAFREIESGALDFFPRHLKKIRLPEPDRVPAYDDASGNERTANEGTDRSELYVALHDLGMEMRDLQERYADLDTELLGSLGNYEDGPNLPDVGLYQPVGSSVLDATTEEYDTLRIGDVRTERDGGIVTIYATVRYKPTDESSHETDRWGYTETGYHEAFSLADLSHMEAELVESFIPTAVEKGDGFAGFRDNATKTLSPIDRLEAIELPDLTDVADDLRRYVAVKERTEELRERIEVVDRRINQTVYHLYGLTDEEVETVESAVQDD